MKIDNKIITTIASDLDGTLLPNPSAQISMRFFSAANKLLNNGVKIIIASGRQYPNIKKLFAPILERIAIIAENGGLIILNGHVLHRCSIPHELAMKLVKDMADVKEAEILVSTEHTNYTIPRKQEFIDFLKKELGNVVTVPTSFESIEEDILKIGLIFRHGISERIKKEFLQKYGTQLMIVDAGDGFLDFIPNNSGKGQALQILSKAMDFELNELAVFGDSENDISMLKIAGVSFAMEKASEKVKNSATHVCASVEEVLEKMY